MEYHVIDLEITVYERPAIFWLCSSLGEEADHLILVWYLTDRLASLDIFGVGLVLTEGLEELDLSIVEPLGLAERFHID